MKNYTVKVDKHQEVMTIEISAYGYKAVEIKSGENIKEVSAPTEAIR